jgi:hypothetical protein
MGFPLSSYCKVTTVDYSLIVVASVDSAGNWRSSQTGFEGLPAHPSTGVYDMTLSGAMSDSEFIPVVTLIGAGTAVTCEAELLPDEVTVRVTLYDAHSPNNAMDSAFSILVWRVTA